MNNMIIRNGFGLVSINSIEYVEELFRIYSSKTPAVLLKKNSQEAEINGIKLDKIFEPSIKTGWFTPSYTSNHSEEIAHVAFTSGTEGEPKAIAISHLALENTAKRLIDVMGLDESIKEYIGAPVNFSFGLGRCRAIARAGGKGYLPPRGFDPIEISRMLGNGDINAISAVPTLWRILLENNKYFEKIGEKLKWIEIGSQYMSKDEKIALRTLFPKAKIVQHYGLTEASRTTFLDITNENDALESVGKPTGDLEIHLNEENKICIKGTHMCSGIVIDGVVESLCDDSGWFETNDFGEIIDNFLYYKGRADDIINCGGIKVSPDFLEREVRQSIDDVNLGFCISKIPDDERGEIPVLVLLKDSSEQKDIIEKVIIKELKSLGLNLPNLPTMLVDQFPTTATGKIQRKVLTSQYGVLTSTKKKTTQEIHSVGDIYEKIFKISSINIESSFDSLGGDSLNYVRVSIALEEYFGYLPDGWNKLSINELAKKPITKTKNTSVETNILLRSIAIIVVVLAHSGMTSIGGGTQLLIVLVGFNLARFQSSHILSGRVWSSVYNYSLKIIIPYLILVIAYFIWKHTFSLDRLFFYTNLIPMDQRTKPIFPEWFFQVLLQSLVILGALFSFRKIRKIFKKDIWFASYLLLVFFVCLRFFSPYIYNTDYLYNLVPSFYLASLWLGWVIFFSETMEQKLTVFITALILSVLHLGLGLESLWVSMGSFLLLFTNNLVLPFFLKKPLVRVASAALYIYLFHMIFIYISNTVLKLDNVYINFIFGFIGSIFIWYLSELEALRKLFFKCSNLAMQPVRFVARKLR